MVNEISHGGLSVAFGARQIPDDFLRLVVWRIDLLVDGRERAKEQVTRVGHDGGTARGDAILRLEAEKPGEKVVDRDGGLEFGETGDGRVSERKEMGRARRGRSAVYSLGLKVRIGNEFRVRAH